MTRLTHDIANSIASRPRSVGVAEKSFFVLHSMAEGIAFIRETLTRAVSGGAKAVPEHGRVIAQQAKVVAKRAAEVADAPPVEKTTFAARRRWRKELKDLGRAEVAHWIDATAHLGDTAGFTRVDTGLMHGAYRYPSRGFVKNWLNGDEDVGGEWRILAIIAIGAMSVGGALLWMVL